MVLVILTGLWRLTGWRFIGGFVLAISLSYSFNTQKAVRIDNTKSVKKEIESAKREIREYKNLDSKELERVQERKNEIKKKENENNSDDRIIDELIRKYKPESR